GAGPPEVPPEEPPPAPGDVAAVGPGSQPGGGRVVVAEVRRAGQLHPRGHPRTRRRGDRPAHPTEVRPGPLESALEPQQTAVPDATEQIALLTCESVVPGFAYSPRESALAFAQELGAESGVRVEQDA